MSSLCQAGLHGEIQESRGDIEGPYLRKTKQSKQELYTTYYCNASIILLSTFFHPIYVFMFIPCDAGRFRLRISAVP